MKPSEKEIITVFYDGACPSCVRDREYYERLSGNRGKYVEWFDITDKDQELCQLGIDPKLALTELHIQTQDGNIISEIDAYRILLDRTIWLKPVAYLLRLPLIKSSLARIYHNRVNKRLRKTGRI